jgi:hypothetical protein
MGGVVDLGAYEFQSPVHYVKTVLFGVTPVSPFTNWVTAATNIQDAVNAANAGDFIIVSNGIYQSGGATQNGYALSNRVAINKAVTVQSVNGAAFTVIAGLPGTGGYPSTGIRCVYLTNGATLAGFTLTNGATDGFGADPVNEQSGAAAWCESTNATISDCVLVHSYASEWGGGAYRGTLNNCVISNDTAFINGGGTYGANLNNCIVSGNRLVQGFGGGGVCFGTLDHCLVSSNSAFMGGGACSNILNYCVVKNNSASTGGGACYCTMLNCELNNNLASSIGGGAYQSSLVNCTIVSNAASGPSLQPTGGGLYGGRASNCIIYYNLALKDPNVSGTGPMAYCCTTPLPAGPGNLTNAPVFVDLANGDFHLQSSSPCINAGNNAYVSGATDLDGNPRIIGGTVDMGAYEFQSPTTVPFFAALQTPTNNSPGLTITWQSVNGVNYFIQRSGDLAVQPPFATIQSNIIGLPGMTSYTDTGAVGAGPFFYRVGVQP